MRRVRSTAQTTQSWKASRRAVLGGAVAAGVAGTACGGGGAGGVSAQATAAPRKGPVSIDVLTRNGVAAASGHSQFYDKQARNRFTPETQITVNFIDAQPNVGEKLTVLAAGGTLPDGSWFGVLADGAAGREQSLMSIFKPLDDLVKRDSKFDRAPYFKAILDTFTINGKLFALPTHGHYGTNVLYYNKNMTGAAGIAVPDDGNWSIDDLIVAAQKLVRRDQDVWGYNSPWGFPEFGVFYLRQFGGEWLDEAGRRALLDAAEARAGLEWIFNTQDKFQTIDAHYRADNKGFDTLFVEGKLGFVNWTPGYTAQWKAPGPDQISPANNRFELGVALFPRGPNGRRGTQVSGSGMGLCSPEKQEATWEWLKFATNQMNGVEQVFGGAGSPGARTDVWQDPRLLSFDPIYGTIVKAYAQGAGPLRLPANNRYTDLLKATTDE
ncbi:MAG TPA: extracellular solute-binding protein, partial [Chloroflexota bacterium]|nr:extracellular solute-binding protein [Chloroflexota bacterium]